MPSLSLEQEADAPLVQRHSDERLEGRLRVLGRRGQDVGQRPHRRQEDLGQELLLAGEVAVQRGRADRDRTSDIAERHVLVAAARELVAGRGEDQLLRFRGRLPCRSVAVVAVIALAFNRRQASRIERPMRSFMISVVPA